MKTERAILAGGCFWGLQDLVRRYAGIVSTRVGYSGGELRSRRACQSPAEGAGQSLSEDVSKEFADE